MLCLKHTGPHTNKVCTCMHVCIFATHLGNVTLHFHLKGNNCFNNTVYPQQYNIIRSYLCVMLICIFAWFIFSSGLICLHSFICRSWLNLTRISSCSPTYYVTIQLNCSLPDNSGLLQLGYFCSFNQHFL